MPLDACETTKRHAAGLERLLILLVLGLGLALELAHLTEPPLDRHAWKQTELAQFAYNFYRHDLNILRPETLSYPADPWGMGGYKETEFQLYPWLVAGLWRLFGMHEPLGRGVAIAFTLATAWMLYRLVRHYAGARAGILAALALFSSPIYVFYGRAFMSEPLMLFLTTGALYAFALWLEHARWRDYALATLALALAGLVKLPSFYLLLPLGMLAWLKYRWRLARCWPWWLFLVLVVLPSVGWYGYAHSLFRSSGLTFGQIWEIGGDKWGNARVWLDREFYLVLWERLRSVMFSTPGLLAGALGVILRVRRKEQYLFHAWGMAVVGYVFILATGNKLHDYYQLPLLPVGAAFIGLGLDALARPGAVQLELWGLRRWAPQLLALLLVGLMFRSARQAIQPLYVQNRVIQEAAEALRASTPEDARIVVIYDWPHEDELFYAARREGWWLWIVRTDAGEYQRLFTNWRRVVDGRWVRQRDWVPNDIFETLRAQGAVRVVVSLERGDAPAFLASEVGRYLEQRYRLLHRSEHWLIYDLV